MASHQKGDKPLPEPMMTQFTDAYMRLETSVQQSTNNTNHHDDYIYNCTAAYTYVC